ncbi:MAG: AP-4-A phosphorylase [bacterium]|nr:AP-4-A phosphorylase [bacterium]
MSEEILWAPWRMQYILGSKEPGCIFCDKPRQSQDRENLIVQRGAACFVIMNKYPYNNGHLMIVPYRHEAQMENLTVAENQEMMALLQEAAKALKKVMSPHGFNIGMNVGKTAGAGIEAHLHFHLVPRWDGDTNFMPVVGHTKVVSEGLWETWEKLREVFKVNS